MLSFNRFKYKPLLLPIFLIICVIGIDFIVQFKFQLISQPVIDLSFLIKLVISSVLFTVLVGGFEEIGWRGYLTSKIIQYKMPWNQLIVITSIIWSIWHLPTHFQNLKTIYISSILFYHKLF